jgi:cysteine desulfurase
LKNGVYLDYAATTPVDPRVVEAMQPYWTEIYGNSASIHSFGRRAARGLEAARQQVADVLACRPTEIVFTASGTESDNLAIRGLAWAARLAGRGQHIITTPIEHHAVGHTVAQLCERFGFESAVLPVDAQGRVNPGDVGQAIRDDTILISVMYANNEVGVIQPLAEIGQIARSHGIPFHSDAVQAGGKLDLDVGRLNVDLLSLSAHKFYGPKGVGALYVRREINLAPTLTGGGHERGQRPGTVNVAGNVGLGAALHIAAQEREEETARLTRLRDRLIAGVLERVPDAQLTGHPTQRLACSASFAFKDCDGEALLLGLDLAGIAASTGSACLSGDPEPSHVLAALGLRPEWGIGSLRLTLGRWTTAEQIDLVLQVLPGVVEKTRTLPT